MVLASHGIMTAYGFWLPNDPRGSWSDFVRCWELLKFGRATKIDTTQSVAATSHDREQRLAAKEALKYPAVTFTGEQARAIARGFARSARESGYRILACSIMPDHVHVVPERHERPVETIMKHLKTRATQQLVAEGLHPFSHLKDGDGRFPSVWADRAWKVFLDLEEDIERAVLYAKDNPVKQGLKTQNWKFIVVHHV